MKESQEQASASDPQMQLRPRFLLELVIIVAMIAFLVRFLRPDVGGPGSDRRIARYSISHIASALDKLNKEMGAVTNIAAALVSTALLETGQNHAVRTNAQGEMLDVWNTPYQITIESSGRFVIRSAGHDRRLGNEDDIIYDSMKRGFVKP